LTAVSLTPEQKLDVVPSVSVKDGEVVIVKGGRYERLEDEDGRPLEPAFFVEQVIKQYPKIMLVDINGIEDNTPQMELLTDVAELGEIWVDSGTRFAEGMIDVLVSGVSAVVLSTKTLAGVDQLAAAFEMSENVYLGIDWDGQVQSHSEELKHMSPRSLADIAGNLGIKKLLFNDLSRTAAAGSRPPAEGDGQQATGSREQAAGSGEQATGSWQLAAPGGRSVLLAEVPSAPRGSGLQVNKPLQLEIIRELAKGPLRLYVGGGIIEGDLAQLKQLGAAGALLSVLAIVTEAA